MSREFRRRFARRCTVILAPLVLAALVLPGLTRLPRARISADVAGVTAGWLLLGIAALAWWLYQHRRSPVGGRWPAPLTWAAGAASVLRSVGMATGLGWANPVSTTVIALLAGVLGWLLAGPDPVLPVASKPPDPGSPRLSLPPRARAMWYRQVRSGPGLALAALLAGLGLVGVLTAANTVGTVGVLALVLAATLAAHSWASVRIDQQGIVVTQPLLRHTLIKLPYAHIRQATSVPAPTELPRHHYGTVAAGPVFGYRARPSGSALRLALPGGRTCVITVDDPHTAAALINTQLDRQRESC